MSKLLDQELAELKQRVVAMAHDVRQSMGAAIAALVDSDAEAAGIVREADRAINEQRFSLESDTVAVIATQQPVAGDARQLAGSLEIATELERMGDYAQDIARIAQFQSQRGSPNPPAGIVRMSNFAAQMLERAMQAFVDGDPELAAEVANEDDAVDELCWNLHRELVKNAYADESALEAVIRLLPAIHDVERFADRVTNICERVVYIATGEQVEFNDRH